MLGDASNCHTAATTMKPPIFLALLCLTSTALRAAGAAPAAAATPRGALRSKRAAGHAAARAVRRPRARAADHAAPGATIEEKEPMRELGVDAALQEEAAVLASKLGGDGELDEYFDVDDYLESLPEPRGRGRRRGGRGLRRRRGPRTVRLASRPDGPTAGGRCRSRRATAGDVVPEPAAELRSRTFAAAASSPRRCSPGSSRGRTARTRRSARARRRGSCRAPWRRARCWRASPCGGASWRAPRCPGPSSRRWA